MATTNNAVLGLAAEHPNGPQDLGSDSTSSNVPSDGDCVTNAFSSNDTSLVREGEPDSGRTILSEQERVSGTQDSQELLETEAPATVTPAINDPLPGEDTTGQAGVDEHGEVHSDNEGSVSTRTESSIEDHHYRRYRYSLERNRPPLRQRICRAPKRVRQYEDYIRLMEERVSALEQKLHMGALDLERVVVEASKRLPAMSKLNRLPWTDFKQAHTITTVRCAIDILNGEPIIQSFRRKPGAFGTFAATGNYDESGILGQDSPKDSKERAKPVTVDHARLPERVRINSLPIQRILEKVFEGTITYVDRPFLLFRPFKSLTYFEDEIRDWLKKVENKWDVKTEDKPTEGIVTIVGDNDNTNTIHPEGNRDASDTADERRDSEVDDDSSQDDRSFPEHTGSLEALRDLRCLVEFLDADIKPVIDYVRSDECLKISFDNLWHLFKPGDEVLASSGRQQAFRVTHVSGIKHHASIANAENKEFHFAKLKPAFIHCVYMDFDGKRLGPVPKEFQIPRYDGEKGVFSLPIYPFRLAKDASGKRGALISRGKKFMTLTGVKHVYCKGISLDAQEEIDSQVIVDFEQALAHHTQWEPGVIQDHSSEDGPGETDTSGNSQCSVVGCCSDEIVYDESYVDKNRTKDFTQERPSLAVYSRLKSTITELSDDELVLLTNRVFAFVLRSRKWAWLDINEIRDVRRNKGSDSFDSLVLPDGHKEMVKSLVKQHFRERKSKYQDEEQIDLVRGKGNGLILLLHGAPGVGKTSTAECVAESFGKPLFPITCGDLGVTPQDIERNLERNFTLAHRWGCVLLLDEADIFLAARTKEDFLHNSLVSVFLRVLEYYAGILFLTTNRVGSFDEAFKSRIHISLYYPPLEERPTIEVWKMNLRRTKDRMHKRLARTDEGEENIEGKDKIRFKIDKKEILAFAKDHFNRNKEGRWNGRQIRNAFQTAIALAEYDMQGDTGSDEEVRKPRTVRLRKSHFKTVEDASSAFEEYLKQVYGGKSAGEIAKNISVRYDDFGAPPPVHAFVPPGQPNVRMQYEQPPWSMHPNHPLNNSNNPGIPKQSAKSESTSSKSKSKHSKKAEKRQKKKETSSDESNEATENDALSKNSDSESPSGSASTSKSDSESDSDVKATKKKQKSSTKAAKENEAALKKKKDAKASK